jgi:malate dehydrogenase (quinone)
LATENGLGNPSEFVRNVPHLSFVWGSENVDFLRKRHELLAKNPLFEGFEYSENFQKLASWMPLVMRGRDPREPVAATKSDLGTDVDFGELTRRLFVNLEKKEGVFCHTEHEVWDLKKRKNGGWRVFVRDLKKDEKEHYDADFVFVGAGGATLPLMQSADLAEIRGFAGFPISGQWLVCENPAVFSLHHAKVYGKAAVGAPPMSVPHLDTRVISGKKALLFGPFAGFSTKFLKKGSYLDLPESVTFDNFLPMMAAGWHNLALTKYLIEQIAQSDEDRFDALKQYFPEAKMADWRLEIAGQRVQIIKKDAKKGGVLEFGTELVIAADGSMAGLLGASPGASTAVSAMLEVVKKCFKNEISTPESRLKLKKMIPSLGLPMTEKRLKTSRAWSREILGI